MVRFSFLLMLSILTLVSCGDDDSNDVNNSDIVGTWKLISSESGSELESGGISSRSVLIYQSGDLELEFKADGTYEQMGTGIYNFVSIIAGDTLLSIPTTVDPGQTGTYTAVNGRLEGLIVTNSDPNVQVGSQDNTVTTYTISNGVLTIDLSGTTELTSDGQTFESDVFGTVVYDRL